MVTLGKLARVAADPTRVQRGASRRHPALRLQLWGLLEQLMPQLWLSGTNAAAGSGSPGSAEQGCPQLQLDLRSLSLNRGLGGCTLAGAAGSAAAPHRLPTSEEQMAGAALSTTPPSSWAAGPHGSGPTWQQVVDAGGCPAPGTPQQRQLLQLTALAVAEWLPVLLNRRYLTAAPSGAVLPTPLCDLLPHGAYRVAWAWLRLVALQEAEEEGERHQQQRQQGGVTAPQRPWSHFLIKRVIALGQVVQVTCGAKVQPGLQPGLQPGSGVDDPECVSAAREVLPAAKDVLQVVSRLLKENGEGQEAKSQFGGQGPLWGSLQGVVRGLLGKEGRGSRRGCWGD